MLHTAQGPPAPAAWLFDLTLHHLHTATGFAGLRIAHVLLALAVVGLAAALLRGTRSTAPVVPSVAWLGLGAFVALSAYRLFQLRPHLVTLLATLAVLHLILRDGAPPSWRRVGACALLFALWANAHGGFLLGLVLLGGAALALAAAAWLRPQDRARHLPRARRLAAAFVLSGVASLANPSFADQHLLYFAAGADTPALEVVADEWAGVDLFAPPRPGVPPSPLSWLLLWLLLPASIVAGVVGWRRRTADPALLALTAGSWIVLLSAVRLTWLAIVPIVLFARALPSRPAPAWFAAVAAAMLVPAFVLTGAWPAISGGVHRALYALPYPVSKHPAQATWLLRDAGLEGHLWNDYASGNFLGYWLAPELRPFVNGSLNVPLDAMASLDVVRRRADEGGETLSERLDRHGVDLFVGTGLPVMPGAGRSMVATTAHLEGEPGWLPIYRSPRSGLYLRRGDRNEVNLERVAAYYEAAGVPFDRTRGFDPAAVIRQAPDWALAHGVLPVDHEALRQQARSLDPRLRGAALDVQARDAALLGLYERALELDARSLRRNPQALGPARRAVWSRIRLGDLPGALEAADALAAIARPDDAASQLLIGVARQLPTLPASEQRSYRALVPLLGPGEMQHVLGRLHPGEVRTSRR